MRLKFRARLYVLCLFGFLAQALITPKHCNMVTFSHLTPWCITNFRRNPRQNICNKCNTAQNTDVRKTLDSFHAYRTWHYVWMWYNGRSPVGIGQRNVKTDLLTLLVKRSARWATTKWAGARGSCISFLGDSWPPALSCSCGSGLSDSRSTNYYHW